MSQVRAWLIVGVLVALVAGAFIFHNAFGPKEAAVPDELYQVYFTCDDTSHFVAHFTSHDMVEIDVDGQIVRELPVASSTRGLLYEDPEWSLELVGTMATVTRLFDDKSGSCREPMGLWAHNFGS